MTIRLHLGVEDVAYNEPPATPRISTKQHRKKQKIEPVGVQGTQTTGDVATWLENKYGIMAYFAERHQTDIADALAEAAAGALENALMGSRANTDPFAAANSAIEDMFKQFLSLREMDGQPGVPTMAALQGRSKRFKKGRGSARPSFIDTGLYQSAFKAWVD